jgi:hypothetical protein
MAFNFPGGVIVNDRNAGVAIPIRRAVRAATTAPGTLATSFEAGDTIDSVVLAAGDRILIKNQASAVENGIYVVEPVGAPYRDVDFEVGASVAGMIIPIVAGGQTGSFWNCTNILGADIVGVNLLTFAIAGGSGASGNVNSGGASTDNAVVRWDGATGLIIQNSGVILSDTNNMTGLLNVGMAGDILDAAGNELVNFTSVASAVNEIAITNAAAATNPILGVSGGDVNISLEYLVKGTGVHIFDNDTAAAEIRLRDDAGTDFVGIRAAAATTSYTVTMPAVQGLASTYLQNNGTGLLSWATGTSGALSYLTSTSDVLTSTTSTVYVLANSMQFLIPAAGTWLVIFSSSIASTQGNRTIEFIISINGGASAVAGAYRMYNVPGANIFIPMGCSAVVTVTGVENIAVYYRISNAAASAQLNSRSFSALKLT